MNQEELIKGAMYKFICSKPGCMCGSNGIIIFKKKYNKMPGWISIKCLIHNFKGPRPTELCFSEFSWELIKNSKLAKILYE